MYPNEGIAVEHESGWNIVGNCTKRDYRGNPTEVVTYDGKVYVANENGIFEEKR